MAANKQYGKKGGRGGAGRHRIDFNAELRIELHCSSQETGMVPPVLPMHMLSQMQHATPKKPQCNNGGPYSLILLIQRIFIIQAGMQCD